MIDRIGLKIGESKKSKFKAKKGCYNFSKVQNFGKVAECGTFS
jgi:hypothetical protein